MEAKCVLYSSYALRRVAVTAVVLLLTIAFLTSAAWAHAEDDDDDEDQGPSTPSATLSLQYDARGAAEATLYTDTDIHDWSPLQSALEQSLHCPAGAFAHPKSQSFSSKYFGSLSAKQRARFEEMATREQMRTLQGNCPAAMIRDGFMIYTGVALAPVLAELGKIGEQQLHVSVTYRATKYARPLPFAQGRAGNSQFQHSTYDFDVSDASSASLHLQFGLTRADAIRAAALPLVILLLPIAIMLWMQFAALRDAKRDPTAAWFSYFRTLTWCTNGIMLLWMVGNSVRRGAEDLAAYYLAGHDGRAIALRLAILLLPPWIVYIVCLLSSYRVYVQVRGNAWTRREFYSTQLLRVAAQLLPLMCLFAGIQLLTSNSRAAIGCMVAFFFVRKICARLQLKVAKTYPEALTTGELRDRVFELARKAAVEVRQIFIFNWDHGYLFFARERLCYFGDQVRFALRPEQVRGVRIGPGAPSWTSVPRVYLDWWDDATSSIRTWNLVSTMPCSLWSITEQSQKLHDAMQQWRREPSDYPDAPMSLKDLPAPAIGEVTSLSLKSVYAIGRFLKSTFWILFLATALGTALSIPSLWYVCGVILLLRLYEVLPRLFYKKQQYAMQSKAAAVASGRI